VAGAAAIARHDVLLGAALIAVGASIIASIGAIMASFGIMSLVRELIEWATKAPPPSSGQR
jgi:hypothetical protein